MPLEDQLVRFFTQSKDAWFYNVCPRPPRIKFVGSGSNPTTFLIVPTVLWEPKVSEHSSHPFQDLRSLLEPGSDTYLDTDMWPPLKRDVGKSLLVLAAYRV